MPTVFERLHAFLTEQRVPFDVSHHAPVFTSEEAAQVRGAPLSSGAKALILKADEQFLMVVLPADRKLESKRARQHLQVRSIRFATKEEVLRLTGLQPGSIPPFGSLFELRTYVDPALAFNARINFNAGDHAISIQMSHADYLKTESPIVCEVT